MWEHPRTQPVHTQSAVAQSHYSACYWPLSHSAAQHWISQPQPAPLPLWGIDWLLDFLRCSSHTHSLPYPLLSSPLCRSCRLSFLCLSPFLSFYVFSLALCCPCSRSARLSLSPFATVPALLWTTENLI